MKRLFLLLTAALLCGASVLTSCKKDEETTKVSEEKSGIALIVKRGQIEYWRQIESIFRGICQEKGLEAYYYSTTSEIAYQEQVAAVAELRKLSSKQLKGIICAPSYGPNGESAETEIAALANERGIPVVILDSPVGSESPLADRPYFGTDNAAAGRAMAAEVTADRIAAIAMLNSPGIERAEAFKVLKPNTEIYRVGDSAVREVESILDTYDDFVFFNGNDLVGAVEMLKNANKNVYTFDIYEEFLDELIAGSSFFKGIMAQNTFVMTQKAVDAVLTNATEGELVPAFYITSANLNDANVQPFLQFYNKAQ